MLDGRLPTAAAGAVLEAEVLRLETASDVVTRLGHLRDMGTPIAIAGAWTSSGLDSIAMVE